MSNSRNIAFALTDKMTPGVRYSIADLIDLLPNTDFEFTTLSKTAIPSEPGRPRWNRWVRNAVRNSPDRTDLSTNWWVELKAEWIGPSKNDWEYWIVAGDEEIISKPLKDSERPIQNDGWIAEQKVKKWLEDQDFTVWDVSREGCGFDLLAQKESLEMFVEVKSSSSLLSLTLTKNEWETAKQNRDKYWIAYFENFDPDIDIDPKWIQDPAKIKATERQTVEYFLPKEQWNQ